MKIVTMLNEVYTKFDALVDPVKNPNVYKVRASNESNMQIFVTFV